MIRILRSVLPATALIVLPLTTNAVELETEPQKYSYALGYQTAQSLQRAGVQVDPDAFAEAIRDVLSGGELKMPLEEMRAVQQARALEAQKVKLAQAEVNLKNGQAFLAANRTKEGIQALPSGLQYRVEKEGAGASPTVNDTVVVNYRGTLTDGTEFDSTYQRGQPATFSLGKVIKGFSEALTNMKPGAKWTIYVPAELGYGMRGAGSTIGPNQTLIFDIELLEIKT